MKHAIRCAVAVAVASATGAVHAADMRPITKAPPTPAPVPAFSWTGCYLGGALGGQWGRGTGDIDYPGDTFGHPAVAVSRDLNGSGGFLYGGQLGCNWQPVGSTYVFGIEGDVAGINHGRVGDEIYRFVTLPADHFNEASVFGTQESIRLRLGYSLDQFLGFDRALLYVAGGWSRARISASDYFYRDGDGSLAFATSRQRDGWNIGAGAEMPLANKNWTIGLEYRFTDYGSAAVTIPGGTAGSLNWVSFTAGVSNISTQDVRLRLNYLFGTGALFGTGPNAYARY